MVTVAEPRQSLRIGFFRSFAAYDIPLRPQDPISFEDTKALSSYCLVQFEPEGRISSFTKIILERQGSGELPLAERFEPGAVMFFKESAPGEEMQRLLSKSVPYSETQNQEAYYRGTVASSGRGLCWELLARKVLFKETYKYHPDGKLKERVVHRGDGSVSRWLYDEKGQAVPVTEE
jgi:hypothetical protein